MPKFFVMSDIHGFYDEMIDALIGAGFDESNPDHWVITCGDHFDRGGQPLKVMRYLRSLPRKVLIRGNHEQLLEDCIDRGYYMSHDWSNGTMQTILDLSPDVDTFAEACTVAEWKTSSFIGSMVNYFETKNYIFVHGWIPLKSEDGLPAYYERNRVFSYNPDWRTAHQKDWNDAMWLNGMKMAMQGFLPDKTVVVGHYHTSWGHARQDQTFNEWGEGADFSPYYADGVIAIDACTAHTGKVNVLVIEDDFNE